MRGGKGLPHSMPVTKQAPHSNLTRGGPKLRRWQVAIAQVAPYTGRKPGTGAFIRRGSTAQPFPFFPEYYYPKKSDLNVKDTY